MWVGPHHQGFPSFEQLNRCSHTQCGESRCEVTSQAIQGGSGGAEPTPTDHEISSIWVENIAIKMELASKDIETLILKQEVLSSKDQY